MMTRPPGAGQVMTVHMLRRHGAVPCLRPGEAAKLLCQAVANNSREALYLILDAGLDASEPYHDCSTPLHVAVGRGNLFAVRLLLDKGEKCGLLSSPQAHNFVRALKVSRP